MLIFKERLPENTIRFKYIEMPYDTVEEARNAVLHVGLQYEKPCMWYDAKEYDLPMKKYLVIAIGTGHYWSDILTRDMYIGTALLECDSFVVHYFLVETDNTKLNLLL